MAALTRNDDDAGTSSTLNLTVNVDGEDIVDADMGGSVWPVNFPHLDDGEAGMGGPSLSTPFNSNGLTNSSICLGIRGDNAWGPEHVLLFGVNFAGGPTVGLAMETDLTLWLSTDPSDGGSAHLTMPLRLVGSGGSLIRRVLMLVWTQDLTPVPTD